MTSPISTRKRNKPTLRELAAREHRQRERVAWQEGYDKAIADMLEKEKEAK